jgi:dTDP-4-amino-4,6-dideoxygalactose transaminase
MDRLEGFLKIRARNAKHLMDVTSDVPGVKFTQMAKDRTHVFYLYTLFLRKNRDAILKRLNERGVGAAVYFHTPVHKTPLYSDLGYGGKRLKNTESACRHVLSLPVHPGVDREDIEKVGTEFLGAAREFL